MGFDYSGFERLQEVGKAKRSLIREATESGIIPKGTHCYDDLDRSFHGVLYRRFVKDGYAIYSSNAKYFCVGADEYPDLATSTGANLVTKVYDEIRVRPLPKISETVAMFSDRRAHERNETRIAYFRTAEQRGYPNAGISIGTFTELDKAIVESGTADASIRAFSPWRKNDYPNAIVLDSKSPAYKDAAFIARAFRPDWEKLTSTVQAVVVNNVALIHGPDLNTVPRAVFITGDERFSSVGDRLFAPEVDMGAKLAHAVGVRIYNLDHAHNLQIAKHDLEHGNGRPMEVGIDPRDDLEHEYHAILNASGVRYRLDTLAFRPWGNDAPGVVANISGRWATITHDEPQQCVTVANVAKLSWQPRVGDVVTVLQSGDVISREASTEASRLLGERHEAIER